ncbi:MAG: hypothetical protein KA297_19890 [Kofleriaceae bacterium]|jgi:hypothetical protein|nr:hypothetical protein [Kofleriaceae bacterium]MBP6839080.1 hypothetical protein [Kofleriaceae bacterium]
MKALQLTPFAKVRIWWARATPAWLPVASKCRRVEGGAQERLSVSNVTIEAAVGRGAKVAYGLLGFAFDERPGNSIDVVVPYSAGGGDQWVGSLVGHLDDVRLGLPLEYAEPVLLAAASFASHCLPPGRLATVEAAHGAVGSSADFYQRLTLATLSVLRSGSAEDEELRTLLKGILVY